MNDLIRAGNELGVRKAKINDIVDQMQQVADGFLALSESNGLEAAFAVGVKNRFRSFASKSR